MQNVIQEFTIGFFDSSGVFSIYMKKDDTNRYLKFHICDNTKDYIDILSNPHLAISIHEQLPSGVVLPDIPIDNANIDLEERSVTCHVVKEMVQQSGVAHCEIMFALPDEHLVVTTVPFKLIIDNNYTSTPTEDTQVMYDTWSELYIAVKGLENRVSADEVIRVQNENERISQENARQAAEQQREAAVGAQVEEARRCAVISGSAMRVAGNFAEDAEAYAVGKRGGVDVPSTDETYHNNSKYYRDQAQSIMDELDGTVRAQGTCTFAELPAVADARPGDMWNVSDEFITTSDFREGVGITVPAGANVYMTTSSKWDVFAGNMVVGVKGNAETDYRSGNVNLTPMNIGALAVDGDSKDNVATFTSYDEQPTNKTVADGFTGTEYPEPDSGTTGYLELTGYVDCLAKVQIDNTEYVSPPYKKMPVKKGSVIILYKKNPPYIWAYIDRDGNYHNLGRDKTCYSVVSQISDTQSYITMYEDAVDLEDGRGWATSLVFQLGEPPKSIPALSTGEQHKSIFSKISAMFMNIRKIWNSLTASYDGKLVGFRFGIDADGNYGYYKDGADTVTPFKTVVNLGTGTSFDLSSYANYGNLTEDNFYIVCTSYQSNKTSGYAASSQFIGSDVADNLIYNIECSDGSVSISKTLSKSYDQATGVLTIGNVSGSQTYNTKVTMRSGQSIFRTATNTGGTPSVSASINYYVLLIY